MPKVKDTIKYPSLKEIKEFARDMDFVSTNLPVDSMTFKGDKVVVRTKDMARALRKLVKKK